MAQTQTRVIQVKVDTTGAKGIKEIVDGFKGVNKSISQTNGILGEFQSSFGRIKSVLGGFLGFQIAKQFTDMADSFQKATDRLTITEGSVTSATAFLSKLTKVAIENKASIEDTTVLYTRYSAALDATGTKSEAVLEFTNLLQKSFRISGATAEEAASSGIQLGQGLAAGALRGQELRSVLESNVLIGKLLAAEFGVARGELLKYSEAVGGLDAARVINAIADSKGELNEKAAKLSTTVGESLANAFTKLKVELGAINSEFGITKGMVEVIDAVSDAFSNRFIQAIVGATLAWGAYTVAVAVANKATTAFLASAAVKAIAGFLLTVAAGATSFALLIGGIPIALGAAAIAIVAFLATLTPVQDAFIGAGKAIKNFFSFKLEDKYLSLQRATKAGTQENINYKNSIAQIVEPADEFSKSMKGTFDTFMGSGVIARQTAPTMKDLAKSLADAKKETFNFKEELGKLNTKQMDGKITVAQYAKEVKKLQIRDLNKDYKDGAMTLDQYNEKLRVIELGKPKKNIQEFREQVEALNRRFNDGKMSVQQYAVDLQKLEMGKVQDDLTTGQASKLDELAKKREMSITALNIKYVNGKKTMGEYRAAMRDLEMSKIGETFDRGAMSADEYHRSVVSISEELKPGSALYVGAADYAKSVGNLNQNIAAGITTTFGRLENAMVEFTTTGKFVFKDFAKAVLEDINRIIIRAMIIRPIAEGILSGIGAGGNKSSGNPADASFVGPQAPAPKQALGGVWEDGIQKFAKGGVVSRPTYFNHASGKGLMGERGSEAIIPLKRGANGELGVQGGGGSEVTVNILNNASGTEVETRETTDSNGGKKIEVMIKNVVSEGMARGDFDKQFRTFYGLNRR